jgi:hypothetical protein
VAPSLIQGEGATSASKWSARTAAWAIADATTEVTAPLPAGRWRRVLDSAGDVSADEMVSAGALDLRLAPWQAVVLSNP